VRACVSKYYRSDSGTWSQKNPGVFVAVETMKGSGALFRRA
jgi:hypothetical protein